MNVSRFIVLTCLCASAQVYAQSTLFRCVDDKGMTHYGETMPTACAKKDVTELNKQGRTIRKLDAPLTPEQQRVRDEANLKAREEAKSVAEQRLKDLAMLQTYGAEREIDILRDKDLEQFEQRRKLLESRAPGLDARLKKIKTQMEFYVEGKSKAAKESAKDGKDAAKAVPPQLLADLDRSTADRAALAAEINRVETERKAVAARYETEKLRFRMLKGGLKPGTMINEKRAAAAEVPSKAKP